MSVFISLSVLRLFFVVLREPATVLWNCECVDTDFCLFSLAFFIECLSVFFEFRCLSISLPFDGMPIPGLFLPCGQAICVPRRVNIMVSCGVFVSSTPWGLTDRCPSIELNRQEGMEKWTEEILRRVGERRAVPGRVL